MILQSENGCLMVKPYALCGDQNPDVNASQLHCLPEPRSLDWQNLSIIRGGHVNTAILGALDVSQYGDIANWARNAAGGDLSPGMGGAMDLVYGAGKIVCTLQHNDKQGNAKILKECSLAVTGKSCRYNYYGKSSVSCNRARFAADRKRSGNINGSIAELVPDTDFLLADTICSYRLGKDE